MRGMHYIQDNGLCCSCEKRKGIHPVQGMMYSKGYGKVCDRCYVTNTFVLLRTESDKRAFQSIKDRIAAEDKAIEDAIIEKAIQDGRVVKVNT